MPIKSESATPPPRIGKIGPYTVFVTPPATPNPAPKPESPTKTSPVQFEAQTPPAKAVETPAKPPSPPRVMAPPAQFYKEKPSSFAFFWNTVAKVQNGIFYSLTPFSVFFYLELFISINCWKFSKILFIYFCFVFGKCRLREGTSTVVCNLV